MTDKPAGAEVVACVEIDPTGYRTITLHSSQKDYPDVGAELVTLTAYQSLMAEHATLLGKVRNVLIENPPTIAIESLAKRDVTDYKALYHDLIYQVGKKYPGESRHETARRYLIGAESNTGEAAESQCYAALSAARSGEGDHA